MRIDIYIDTNFSLSLSLFPSVYIYICIHIYTHVYGMSVLAFASIVLLVSIYMFIRLCALRKFLGRSEQMVRIYRHKNKCHGSTVQFMGPERVLQIWN